MKKMVEFDYRELVNATASFSPSSLIGKGSHGSVYKAKLEGNKTVAIKKSSNGVDHVSNDNSNKLDNEISVLSSLHKSPYIINFLGTSHQSLTKENNHNNSNSSSSSSGSSKLLVMEFMPNGSLHDLLHANPTPPSWPKRIEIAIQIAKAIQFLHEGKPSIIHRDIKSANILFDANWNAKLSDYGLAVFQLGSLSHKTSQPAGTIGYLDPHYTIPSKLSTKTDVFSYGVVLLEIISCRKAIDVCQVPASIVEWATPLIEKQQLMEICDKRIAVPTFMEGTIKHMLYVAARCTSPREENRPAISEIITGMDHCMVKRIKLPRLTSIFKRIILMRRSGKQWQARRYEGKKCDVDSDISKGKILLREILGELMS